MPQLLDRRAFLATSVGALVGASFASCAGVDARGEAPSGDRPLIVSTWGFGRPGNEKAREMMLAGGSVLDGIEQGIRLVEASGNGSVGLSGRGNAAGYAQVDACIMNGPGHQAGSVAAVEGIVHPITAARRVMEDSKHVMLVGEGARWFALEHGVESVDVSAHAAKKKAWLERERAPDLPDAGAGHDTIAMVAIDANGDIAGGCSTSGAGRKLPGRVGDSPIPGAGLYVDNEVGAAGATGLGENVMRHCATYMIVELMRQGMEPSTACEEVIHRIAQRDPLGYRLSMSFIAIDKHGRFGAGSSNGNFPFAVTTRTTSEVRRVKPVTRRSSKG